MVRAEQHRHIAAFLRAVRNEFAVVDREEAHVIAQTRIGLQRKKLVRRDGAKRFERRSACQVYEFLADRLGALAGDERRICPRITLRNRAREQPFGRRRSEQVMHSHRSS